MFKKLRHFGSRVETCDARYQDTVPVGRILAAIQNAVGTLNRDDVARIESILQRYTGSGTVNKLGAAMPNSDATDAGKRAAAGVRAELSHNAQVAENYRTFWDRKNAELRRYGER
jgi:hypothetical protein